jgi:hypothetical protein
MQGPIKRKLLFCTRQRNLLIYIIFFNKQITYHLVLKFSLPSILFFHVVPYLHHISHCEDEKAYRCHKIFISIGFNFMEFYFKK